MAVPVYRDILADVETPLSAYWKLAQDEQHSFLLESVTGGEQLARYSLIGVRPREVVRSKNSPADPLEFLRSRMPSFVPATPDMPAFVGGAVGMIAYDYARYLERLPDTTQDDLGLDELAMMITSSVVVFDHARNRIRVLVLAEEGELDAAHSEIERVLDRLSKPLPPLPSGTFDGHDVECNVDQPTFEQSVRTIKEYIVAGDGIQMVPSLRLSTKIEAHPVTVYRALRSINPSPYMFLLRFGDFDLVGASPELLVSLHGQTARVRPIAGTRRRGDTAHQDDAFAQELLADEKERAEHIMLVDLGRNDLGKVCSFGSVQVNDLMVVERYSHVMHIVSDVTGELAPDRDAYDLLRACFPAGTVSGAPKVRAMQIIDELETTRRGAYAGAVGFFSATGDMDTAIAIRTVLLKEGKAYVQAGAGVVYDSEPTKEYEECLNKARASLRAIELAQSGLSESG